MQMLTRRAFLVGSGAAGAGACWVPKSAASATCAGGFDRGSMSGFNDNGRRNRFDFLCPEMKSSVKIVVIGDTHIGDDDERGAPYEKYSRRMAAAFTEFDRRGNLAKAVGIAAKAKADLVALVGDVVSYPTHSGVEFVRQTMDEGGVPWRYVAGNHDWHYEGEPGPQVELRARWVERRLAPLYQGENPFMYATSVKGLRLVFIDDSTYQILPEQLDFLKKELAHGEPTILLMHIPVHTPGRHIALGSPKWGWNSDGGYRLEGRERWPKEGCGETTLEFCRIVRTAPNMLGIFAGHHHRLEVDCVRGLPQIVTPANYLGANAFLELTFRPDPV